MRYYRYKVLRVANKESRPVHPISFGSGWKWPVKFRAGVSVSEGKEAFIEEEARECLVHGITTS